MKTASVRDLRNRYAEVLSWVGAGQEVIITRYGRRIARLIPEAPEVVGRVDWGKSGAVTRKRTPGGRLGEAEREEVLKEGSGKW